MDLSILAPAASVAATGIDQQRCRLTHVKAVELVAPALLSVALQLSCYSAVPQPYGRARINVYGFSRASCN